VQQEETGSSKRQDNFNRANVSENATFSLKSGFGKENQIMKVPAPDAGLI